MSEHAGLRTAGLGHTNSQINTERHSAKTGDPEHNLEAATEELQETDLSGMCSLIL